MLLLHTVRSFTGGSAVKNQPANAGDVGFDPWVGKIPWRREWLPTSLFLPGGFHGQRSLTGCSLWGHKGLVMTEQPALSLLSTLKIDAFGLPW